MEKNIVGKDVYYTIIWSQPNHCNRHTVMGIPNLAGIVCLFQEEHGINKYLLLYACWKSGVRNGTRDLLDPNFTLFPELIKLSDKKDLMFKYAIVDSHSLDVQDIMYWLIREYEPSLNNSEEFTDSERYKDIYLKEMYEEDEIER